MQPSNNESKGNGTWTYLLLTGLLSSIFYFLIIKSGHIGGGNRFYAFGLMWCPGVAALLTLKIMGRSLSELGWSFKDGKLLMFSYLVPFFYTFITYLVVWVSGLGSFYNEGTVAQWTEGFGLGELAPWLSITLYFVMAATIGMIRSTSAALGEEIGWRGFLVPELYKKFSYTKTSLISGVIWSIYHYPILIFADYNSGTPAWYGLSCFTVCVVSSCFIYTWFRIKSGSLWTGALLHASHNLFVQAIFTPLTADTGNTAYVIDEFGIALPITSVIFGIYFWTRRNELVHN